MAIQVGKTIVAKRERPESDSERERVRKRFRKRKIASAFLVVLLVGLMGFLTYKAATDSPLFNPEVWATPLKRYFLRLQRKD